MPWIAESVVPPRTLPSTMAERGTGATSTESKKPSLRSSITDIMVKIDVNSTDHDQRAGIEIVEIVLLAWSAAGAERRAESRTDYQPEYEWRGEHPDHARFLPVEAHDLSPPQGERGQQQSRGGEPQSVASKLWSALPSTQLAFGAGVGALAGAARSFLLMRKVSMPASRISQYALRKKQPDERQQNQGHEEPVDRGRKRPQRNHAARQYPYDAQQRNNPEQQRKHKHHGAQATSCYLWTDFFLLDFRNRTSLRGLTPELVAGAVNEHILERRFAHRNA